MGDNGTHRHTKGFDKLIFAEPKVRFRFGWIFDRTFYRFFLRIANDFTIFNFNYSIRTGSNFSVVGYHNNSVAFCV